VDWVVVPAVAFAAAWLTFFSGFGLGTLLLPAFAAFFPVSVAVGATAVVHLANNLFKAALVWRAANVGVVVRFGLPATAAALVGAVLLDRLAATAPLATWTFAGEVRQVTPVKLTIAVLMVLFSLFELLPRFRDLKVDARYLTVGGLLSGFFGGLSGHQGALRSAFLAKTGLDERAFIGTGVLVAVMVDVARLVVYGIEFYTERLNVLAGHTGGLIGAATVSAFLGSFLGTRLVERVTLHGIQVLVGVLLILIAVGLASGLL
jgi:uncharacterized membrane protein YfcA